MNNTDKATPRPWHISGENVGILISPKEGSGFDYAVAYVCGMHTDPETQANAELIVRAVNAYDSLVALARHVLECGNIEADGTIGIHETAYLHEKARQCLKLTEEE